MNENEKVLSEYFYTKGYGTVSQRKFYHILRDDGVPVTYREAVEFMRRQTIYQLNQATRQTIAVQNISARYPLQKIQIDLIDYSQNTLPQQTSYVMNIVDVFSRFSWCILLTNKRSETIMKAFVA